MKFLNKTIKTTVDFEGHTSLLIHNLIGCDLNCFGCHNRKELLSKQHDIFYTDEDIIDRVKLNGFMFDAIILSGGEFLLNPIEDIEDFLMKIKNIFKGIIIINTNGTSPDKIEFLSRNNLVDGFHMDIKFNIWKETDSTLISKILGVKVEKCIIQDSFNRVVKYNKGYSEFRTVKYPFLKDEYFEYIKLKCIENGVKWKLNTFI